MVEETLDFYGSDPGAVKYGNFINYYSFHKAHERINNIYPEMFPVVETNDLYCLDIGCNTGELTKELSVYMKKLYPSHKINILAVDIDPMLIQRAQETNKDSDISFMTCNIMDKDDKNIIYQYLESKRREKIDVTFCFSVTMWIHLNNGDDGLLEFLRYIKAISRTILMEPQPWNCYRNAQRRVKKSGKSFELYESLKIRSNVQLIIERVLSESPYKKIYESSNSSWHRKVQSYTLTLFS